jgi:HEAT repeat protein
VIKGILAMSLSGFLKGILPLSIISEIIYLVFCKGRIKAPIMVCMSTSFILGTINVFYELKGAHGESGLVLTVFAPFLLFGFIFAGILLAYVYKWRGTPLLVRREKGSLFNITLIVLILILLLSIFNIMNSFIWAGKIIEQGSGHPVEGAVIVRSWDRVTATPAGGSSHLSGITEALSGRRGHFVSFGQLFFPGIPGLTWKSENNTVIFRPGYKLETLNNKNNLIELEKIPMIMSSRKKELERAERNYEFDKYDTVLFRKVVDREDDFIDHDKRGHRHFVKAFTCQSIEHRNKMKRSIQRSASRQSQDRDNKKNINQLITSLFDRTFDGRNRSAEILGKMDIQDPAQLSEMGRAAESAIEEWGMNQKKFKVMSPSALGKLRAVSLPFLLEAISRENITMKAMAITALGEAGDKRAVEPLLIALNDRNAYIRRSAVLSLRKLNDSAAIKPLISMLNDEDRDVKNAAASVLNTMEKPSLDPFLEALKDRDSFVRKSIAYILIYVECNEEVVNALIDASNDNDPLVLSNVALALGWQCDSRAAPSLIKLLQNDNEDVRIRAAEAFSKVKSEIALEHLQSALKDPSPWVRARAVEALGNIDDERTVTSLIEAWDDHDSDVRRIAADILVEKREQAVEPLMQMLHHDEAYFRWRSAYALAKIKDTQAIESIKPLLKDNSSEVRYIASKALSLLAKAVSWQKRLQERKGKSAYIYNIKRYPHKANQ